MRILISGATGFIGRPLSSFLQSKGHAVVSLVFKGHAVEDSIFWDFENRKAQLEDFNGFDVVIHLAGEPLTINRWNKEKREKILNSRVESTEFLSDLLSQVEYPPKLFFSASAYGYYGNRGEEILTEESSSGSTFLSHVCTQWEQSSIKLKRRGVRVVAGRFGIVLGPNGGALKKMLFPFQLGLGAILGSGEQWISWIHLTDLISAIEQIILSDTFEGPVNLVAPNPVKQKEFASTLAKVLHRPLFLKLPIWLLHMVLGSVADEMLLGSARVEPTKLLASNFSFQYPIMKDALQKILLKTES